MAQYANETKTKKAKLVILLVIIMTFKSAGWSAKTAKSREGHSNNHNNSSNNNNNDDEKNGTEM